GLQGGGAAVPPWAMPDLHRTRVHRHPYMQAVAPDIEAGARHLHGGVAGLYQKGPLRIAGNREGSFARAQYNDTAVGIQPHGQRRRGIEFDDGVIGQRHLAPLSVLGGKLSGIKRFAWTQRRQGKTYRQRCGTGSAQAVDQAPPCEETTVARLNGFFLQRAQALVRDQSDSIPDAPRPLVLQSMFRAGSKPHLELESLGFVHASRFFTSEPESGRVARVAQGIWIDG